MAAGEDKLRLVLSAIDKTAAPLRAVNRRLEGMLAPVRKVRNAFASLAKEAGLPKIGAALGKIGHLARNLAAGAVAAGAGILAFVSKTAEAADNLAEFTRLVGINVEDFQELQFAAKRAGIEHEIFASGMRNLSRNVGAAQAGMGRFAAILKKTSPATLKQIKGTKNTGAALEIVLDLMRRLPDTMKRNELANKAFGNAQLALLATLSPDELRNFREEARRLGMVLSSDAVSGAERLMDNVDDLKGSVLGLARSIAVALFPDLQAATGQLLEWIKANRELIVSGGKEAVLEFARGMKELGTFLSENVPRMRTFVDQIGGLKTILAAISIGVMAPAIKTFVVLAGAIGAVGSAVLGTGAALAYLFIQLERVTGIKGKILDIVDPFTPKSVVGAGIRKVAAAAPGIASDLGQAVGRLPIDFGGAIDIRLHGTGGTVTGARSSLPGVTFNRGRALEAN